MIRKYGSAHALRTTTSYDKASAARAELPVDVVMRYFREHGGWTVGAPTRRRESRTYDTMPLLSCRRRSASALWVAGTPDESASARILRSLRSIHPVTAIRMYDSANTLRTTASYEKAFASRAESRRSCWYGLLLRTRSLEGKRSSPEKRVASVRRHALSFLSSPACFLPVGRTYSE